MADGYYAHKAPVNKYGINEVITKDPERFTDDEWKMIFGIVEAVQPFLDLELSIPSRVDENGRIIPPSYN